jgi:hypothetical protein
VSLLTVYERNVGRAGRISITKANIAVRATLSVNRRKVTASWQFTFDVDSNWVLCALRGSIEHLAFNGKFNAFPPLVRSHPKRKRHYVILRGKSESSYATKVLTSVERVAFLCSFDTYRFFCFAESDIEHSELLVRVVAVATACCNKSKQPFVHILLNMWCRILCRVGPP